MWPGGPGEPGEPTGGERRERRGGSHAKNTACAGAEAGGAPRPRKGEPRAMDVSTITEALVGIGEDFDWNGDGVAMRHWRWPVVSGAAYALLCVVWNAQIRAKRRRIGAAEPGAKAQRTSAPLVDVGDLLVVQIVHNLVLSLGSLAMFLGLLAHLLKRSDGWFAGPEQGEGWAWLFCERDGVEAKGGLWFWCYVYYLSKYYELLDTVIQLLRGRPPPSWALHVFHHACVAAMVWAWLENTMTLFAIGLLFNTAVHTLMYFYYLLRCIGRPPAWKRAVTLFQNVQFATSFVCFIYTCKLELFDGHSCKGFNVLVANLAFNAVLLVEFAKLLFRRKGAARPKDRPRAKAA